MNNRAPYTSDPEEAFNSYQQALINRSDLPKRAKDIVLEYVQSRLDVTDGATLHESDVYVVWFCKTLQNWKALVSTTLPDGMYYEITHNGDQNETYLDVYKKFDNIVILTVPPKEK